MGQLYQTRALFSCLITFSSRFPGDLLVLLWWCLKTRFDPAVSDDLKTLRKDQRACSHSFILCQLIMKGNFRAPHVDRSHSPLLLVSSDPRLKPEFRFQSCWYGLWVFAYNLTAGFNLTVEKRSVQLMRLHLWSLFFLSTNLKMLIVLPFSRIIDPIITVAVKKCAQQGFIDVCMLRPACSIFPH